MESTGTLIARDVAKAYGGDTVLGGVSVSVAPGDVLGVVGPNGAGKSTLLRILAGVDRPDRGTVTLTAGTAGYLPQEPDRAPGETLHDYLARRTGVAAAGARVDAATAGMAAGDPGAEAAYSQALDEWLTLGAADLEPRAQAVCRELGLDPALLALETVALSGGEAARASLAAILLSRFGVLLLDEPTNDLDFDGLDRLEQFVARRPGGAVIVSHDRAFLERTVTRVLELDEVAHTAVEFGGGWAGYLELRATAARHAEERFEAYASERDRLTDRARRQRQWSETGARPARPRARLGRARGARRAQRQRQDDARRGAARPPPARGWDAVGRARRAGGRARPGPPGVRRHRVAPRRFRRAQRAARPGGALAAGQVRPRRGLRGALRVDALPR